MKFPLNHILLDYFKTGRKISMKSRQMNLLLTAYVTNFSNDGDNSKNLDFQRKFAELEQNFLKLSHEKDEAVKEKDEAVKEKDDAVKEMYVAVKEMYVAVKEKDEAVKEMYVAVKEKDELAESIYMKSVEYLFLHGVPKKIHFTRVCSNKSFYIANHAPAKLRTILNRTFELSKLSKWKGPAHNSSKRASYMRQDRYDNKNIQYGNESTIQNCVHDLLCDILYITGNDSELTLLNELTLSSTNKDSSTIRPDIWMLRQRQGRPIAIFEVKSPDIDNTLEHPNVIGQLYDYMEKIRSFYGQNDVIGVLTNFNKWLFCWFPYSDEFIFEGTNTNNPDIAAAGRLLHGSKIISVHDENFMKYLCYIVIKCTDTTCTPVQLISRSRHYVQLFDSGWKWSTLKKFHKYSLEFSSFKSDYYYVLRYFLGGMDGNVMLAMNSTFNFCVIKLYHSSRAKYAELESRLWVEIYGVRTVIQKCVDHESLIMPFVVTCTLSSAGTPSFDFNSHHLFFEIGASVFEDATIVEIENKFRAIAGDVNCYEVAEIAIRKFAKHKYVHNDLSWRHVALLPVFENNNLVRFEPILIDLTLVAKSDLSESDIVDLMMTSLKIE